MAVPVVVHFKPEFLNSLILKLRLFNRELFNLELFNHELFNCEYFNPLGLQVSVEESGVEMFGHYSLHDHTSLFKGAFKYDVRCF
jgi:hypothetical protein